MNRPLIIILILLFLAFLFIGSRYHYLNSSCVAAPAAAATTNSGIWAFDDGKAYDAEANQYYRFKRNGYDFIPETSENFKSTIGNTVTYLKNNGTRALTVTGLYSATEKYSGNLGNLGLARANDIKADLVSQGVPANQIVTEARILREDLFRKDILQRGAYFTFYPKSGKANAVAQSATSYKAGAAPAAGAKLVGKSMTVYFNTNKASLRLSTKERQDMRDIKEYLDAVPGARLEVNGHTDSRGDAASNKKLSQGRAEFTAKQLTERFKIPVNRIVATGYGEEQPVDSAENAEAWKKNRRVEVKLVDNK